MTFGSGAWHKNLQIYHSWKQNWECIGESQVASLAMFLFMMKAANANWRPSK